MKKIKILLFAGTAEGRELVEFCSRYEIPAYVMTATEYGKELLGEIPFITRLAKRLSKEEMITLMGEESIDLVIDATHPYALEVSENIRSACQVTGAEYLRLLRPIEKQGEAIYFDTLEECVTYLEATEGNIFLTTGSKTLAAFTSLRERLYVRVLPDEAILHQVVALGIKGKHIIAMQGPFNEEINRGILKQVEARFLVTKDSGREGGLVEKIEGAKAVGVTPLIIGRPLKEEGLGVPEIKGRLLRLFGVTSQPKITMVGIGMGRREQLTCEAKAALEEGDLIIGADRILEALSDFRGATYSSYHGAEIAAYIAEHPEYEKIVIALSGDVGFYSGSKNILESLEGREVTMLNGVSSLSYLASRIQIPWDQMKVVSLHGKSSNIVREVESSPYTFFLLGGTVSAGDVLTELEVKGYGDCRVYVGERLSYPEEKIRVGDVKSLRGETFNPLSVMVVENHHSTGGKVSFGIEDDAFQRGKVPMTKYEIRVTSLSKLNLKEDSILYDIGAGTGSVSVEAALKLTAGKVYAIEKKREALLLLERNKEAFKVDNLEIILGEAPDVLDGLPAPTHVFIGGSGGQLKEILDSVLSKGDRIQVVINAITLETLLEAVSYLKEKEVSAAEIISLNVAASKEVGDYHMMMGRNPVSIICFKGGSND